MSRLNAVAMILRVFSSPCKLAEMERFYKKKALRILRQQKGCLYAFAGKNEHMNPPEIAMISVWESLDALTRFTGADWKEPKVVSEEAPLLLGKPRLVNYELLGSVIKPKASLQRLNGKKR